MEERLKELVVLFKERDTVRRILHAKDVGAAFEEEEEAMQFDG